MLPFSSAIIGELACGNFPERANFLIDLESLHGIEETSTSETLEFIVRLRCGL